MGLFDKKYCDVCGEKIGILGNRKLEDANLCKTCASKLSPWFNERRHSTLEEIKQQLAYREENKAEVRAFNTTRSYGKYYVRMLVDEDAGKFMVTGAKDLEEANPDVVDFSQVTACDLDIPESRRELKRKNSQGESVSYNPPRFEYSYNFNMTIRVNHPYFDEMRFQLNNRDVQTGQHSMKGGISAPKLQGSQASGAIGAFLNALTGAADENLVAAEYKEYLATAREIQDLLLQRRSNNAAEAEADARVPKVAVNCPYCKATTFPDANGRCEYCGGALNI